MGIRTRVYTNPISSNINEFPFHPVRNQQPFNWLFSPSPASYHHQDRFRLGSVENIQIEPRRLKRCLNANFKKQEAIKV